MQQLEQNREGDNSGGKKRGFGFFKFASRSLRSIDQYGHPIQLNYNGEETFKSSIGGIFTIISLFLVIGYFGILIQALVENDSDIKAFIGYKDYFKQQFEVIPNDNFDFAVRISGDGKEVMSRFLSVSMLTYVAENKFNAQGKYINTEYIEQSSFMIPCTKDRLFKNSRFQEDKNIYDYYANDFWCPSDDLKLEIQQGKKEVYIQISQCAQKILDEYFWLYYYTCETNQTRINKFLNITEIYFYTGSKYFDLTEFDSVPIKDVMEKHQLLFSPNQTRVVEYGLTVNEATGSSSKLSDSLDKFNYTYVQSEFLREYSIQPSKQYINIQLGIQNQYSNIERKNKHFVGVLSETGGILGIVVGFFVIFSGPIQELLFYSSIIAQIFLSEMQSKGKRKNAKQKQKSGGPNEDPKHNQTSNSDPQDEKLERNESFAKTRPQEFQSYVQMIRIIMSRQSFKYTLNEAWKNLYSSIFCCKKASMKKRMYELGKEKIEKELDISSIIKHMREFRLVTKIYLNKYQRQLVPFFKSNMLSSKLEKKIKKEKTQEFNENELKQTKQERGVEVSDNLIQLFTDCKCQSHKSMKILDSIVGLKDDQELDQEELTLKQQLFRGLMREYAVKHIINEEVEEFSELDNQDLSEIQKRQLQEKSMYAAAPQSEQKEGPQMLNSLQRDDDDDEESRNIGNEKDSNLDSKLELSNKQINNYLRKPKQQQ
eukprot:403359614